jgi:hypothetical protein
MIGDHEHLTTTGVRAMKSTKAQIQLRVNDLVQFRLDGAECRHIREYVRVREKEEGSVWYRGRGGKPFSDATLFRLIAKADKQIEAEIRSSRKKLLRQHVGRRRNIFAKAMAQGDLRTAIAASDSEAKLLGLFPPAGVEMTGKDGKPLFDLDALVALVMKAEQAGGPDNASQAEPAGDG